MEMVHLVTASSAFHAQVIAARLGAEGILTETKGADSTWPLPAPVDVLVEREHLATASALLVVDEAEATVGPRLRAQATRLPPWFVGAVVVLIVLCSFGQRWV